LHVQQSVSLLYSSTLPHRQPVRVTPAGREAGREIVKPLAWTGGLPVLDVMQTPASVIEVTRACHSFPAAVRTVTMSPTLAAAQYAPH
jgi:hypothetical protein